MFHDQQLGVDLAESNFSPGIFKRKPQVHRCCRGQRRHGRGGGKSKFRESSTFWISPSSGLETMPSSSRPLPLLLVSVLIRQLLGLAVSRILM